jgi:D-alanyl-D-alanine carboxypeptidase
MESTFSNAKRILVMLVVIAGGSSAGFAADRDRLLYQVETAEGTVLFSQRPDARFNPASVVKVGSSLHRVRGRRPDRPSGWSYRG